MLQSLEHATTFRTSCLFLNYVNLLRNMQMENVCFAGLLDGLVST